MHGKEDPMKEEKERGVGGGGGAGRGGNRLQKYCHKKKKRKNKFFTQFADCHYNQEHGDDERLADVVKIPCSQVDTVLTAVVAMVSSVVIMVGSMLITVIVTGISASVVMVHSIPVNFREILVVVRTGRRW